MSESSRITVPMAAVHLLAVTAAAAAVFLAVLPAAASDARTPGDANLFRTAGNGIVGDGETSKDLSANWRTAAAPGPNEPPALEIFEIQGTGELSSWEGQVVSTHANVVTAVGSRGFFIQTPDARDDLDPDTSNGIYVYTSSTPAVGVGDLVDVSGEVVEYWTFTELSGSPQVTVVGTETVPAPIGLDASLPSPDPEAPGCAIPYECWEGMLVDLPVGTATGPSQSYGSDPWAEFFAVSRPGRTFREIGAEYPGLGGTIPVWDGNPEVFEVDPDMLGPANAPVEAGSSFRATGVMAFDYGDYELWATSFSLTPVPLPVAVRPAAADELTIASHNLYRLFDDVDDPGDDEVVSTVDYQRRLTKISLHIRQVLLAPDIIAVQEVEKVEILDALAARVLADDPTLSYTAYPQPGNGFDWRDIGYLVRDSVSVDAITQLGADETFDYGDWTSTTHDRPPLLLEGSFTGGGWSLGFAVLNLHVRSLIDAYTNPWVRHKRLEQAQSIAQMVQNFQTIDPSTPLVVIGDLNGFEFTDGHVDVVGQICGIADPSQNLLSGPDLVNPNLVIQTLSLPPEQRYSFVAGGTAEALDHALTSIAATPWVQGVQYGRANADAPFQFYEDEQTPLRSSDHDALVLYMTTAGIFADGFETGTTIAWSMVAP